MVYESDNKYFRKCDCCGEIKEIKKQSFLKNLNKQNHYCLSCKQKGDKNHRFGKAPWNKDLTKNDDIRIKNGAEKVSMSKKGNTPWNSGHTYEELKGRNWSNNFKSKISLVKKGVPNYKNRRIIDKSKPASYF